MRWVSFVGAFTLAAAIGVTARTRPATADIVGPCTVAIDGQSLRGRSSTAPRDSISVDAGATATLMGSASSRIDAYSIEMEYAGFAWTVAEDRVAGSSWRTEVSVERYARYGVGLYRVHAISTGAVRCEATALMRITGRNPMSTLAGLGAAAIAAGGAGGAVHLARRAATTPTLGERG